LICYNDHGYTGKTTETCENGETTCYEKSR
nr:RecName: Full=Frontoxin VI; Short=FTx VI [Micrurus frontalis]